MNGNPGNTGYPLPASGVSLKILERPFLYKVSTDELYELDEEGFAGLQLCDGSRTLEETGLPCDFLSFCLDEGLLELKRERETRPVKVCGPSPAPSLRYLEVQVTRRCNQSCLTCYLGDARPIDLGPEAFAKLVGEFSAMGGLRLMVSGGEPLTHPAWPAINALMDVKGIRRVLLTNGTALTEKTVSSLHFDEVQISLDGLKPGHELVRGKGSFERAVNGARLVRESGLELSLATMVHRGNLEEFAELEELTARLGAREWGIDAPCLMGRLGENPALTVTPGEAARAMARAYGGAYHGGGEGSACGLHLMTVGADGVAAQCGFYFDEPLGNVSEGLARCWGRRAPLLLSDIPACLKCAAAEECGGGCRFRAGGRALPDPVMCAAMGVL